MQKNTISSYLLLIAVIAGMGVMSFIPAADAADAPGIPTGLTATFGDEKVTLDWSAPLNVGGSAITDYLIEVSSDDGDNWSTFDDGPSIGTSTTVNNLTNGQLYDFRVSAINGDGTGESSIPASATPATTPNSPTNLKAIAGDKQVTLEWDAPSDDGGMPITDYVVYYKESYGLATWAPFLHDESDITNIIVTGLTNDVEHDFRVYAKTVIGTSLTSDVVLDIIPKFIPPTVPGKPTNLAATPASGQVTLEWNTPSDDGGMPITDYKIEYKGGGSNWTPLPHGDSTTTTTVTSLTNGEEYQFRVSAINDIGTGGATSKEYATPLASLGTPLPVITTPSKTVNTTQITIEGTGNVDDTIKLYNNGTEVDTTPVVTGDWVSNNPSLKEGDNIFTAFAIDTTGTISPPSNSVTITLDTISPVLTLLGDNPQTIEVGVDYTEQGATCNDDGYGDISSNVVDNASAVDTTTPGDYEVTYSCKDAAGNEASTITRTVTVIGDTTPPAIPVITTPTKTVNTTPTTIEGNAEPGVTIKLFTDSFFRAQTTADSNGNWSFTNVVLGEGNNHIKVTAMDAALNESDYSDTITITLDTISPVLTLLGDANITVNENDVYNDLGATCTDDPYEDLVPDVDASAVDTTTPGDYKVTYSCTDTAGNEATTITRTVIVEDTTPPVLTLLGANTIQLTLNEDYNELGATCLDELNGNLLGNIIIDTTGLDTTQPGQYTVTYSCTDVAGNTATEIRTVIVVDPTLIIPDTPTGLIAIHENDIPLSLTWSAPDDNGGPAITNYLVEYKLSDESNWITFQHDESDITNIIVTGLTNGEEYDFKVSAVNSVGPSMSTGISATPAISPFAPTGLIAIPDDTIVTLTWIAPDDDGGSVITDYLVEINDGSGWETFDDGISTTPTATVTDLSNGQSYDFRVSAVNTVGAGILSSHVTATPVLLDTTLPVITLLGDNTQIVEINTTYDELGATCDDEVNGDLTSTIVITGTVDITTADDYTVTYTCKDASGNEATATRTVDVQYLAPTIPVITLLGDDRITVNLNVDYVDEGATCIDDENTDLTSIMVLGGTVNTAIPDVYTLTYDCKDFPGNEAIQVTRTVTVLDTSTPPTAPDAVTDLSATPGDTTVTLSWSAPSNNGADITEYLVHYKVTGTSIGWPSFLHGITDTTATVTGLSNDQSYDFVVYAVNSVDRGDASNIVPATPTTTLVTPPVTPVVDPQTKNKSGGCSGDCTDPTFFKNENGKEIVENGFELKGKATNVVDYHVPWELITLNTDQTYNMKLKVYENNALKWIGVYFGVPEIGDSLNDAEAEVIFHLNYDKQIEEITTVDRHTLVDILSYRISQVDCGYADSQCYLLNFDFVFRDKQKNNVVAIQAVDMARNSAVHYINDGIEIVGDSMNEPLHSNVSVSQGGAFYPQRAGTVELTLVDYKTDMWQDKYGYMWSMTEYGPYIIDTVPMPIRDADPTTQVMTRAHSNFDVIIQYEQDRAVMQFDASKLVSVLGDTFVYQFPESEENYQKELAIKLEIEEDRASKWIKDYSNFKN